jgi:hypothetical protein
MFDDGGRVHRHYCRLMEDMFARRRPPQPLTVPAILARNRGRVRQIAYILARLGQAPFLDLRTAGGQSTEPSGRELMSRRPSAA